MAVANGSSKSLCGYPCPNDGALAASVKQASGASGEEKLLHASKMDFGGVSKADGECTLNYLFSGTTQEEVMTGLPKDGSGTSVRLLRLADKVITMSSAKI